MSKRVSQPNLSKIVLAALTAGSSQPEVVGRANGISAVSTDNGRTTVRCGSCGMTTVYKLLFSKGPRGAMRLQTCPECKAMYFKTGEVKA